MDNYQNTPTADLFADLHTAFEDSIQAAKQWGLQLAAGNTGEINRWRDEVIRQRQRITALEYALWARIPVPYGEGGS